MESHLTDKATEGAGRYYSYTSYRMSYIKCSSGLIIIRGFLRDGGELSGRADPGCKCPPPPNTGFQVYSRKQLKLHLHQKQENPGLITGKVAFAFPGASHCQVLFLRGEKCFCSLTKSTFFFFSLSLKILCGQREPATQSVFKGNLGNLHFPESGCS